MGHAPKGCRGAARLNWRGVQCLCLLASSYWLTPLLMSWILKHPIVLIVSVVFLVGIGLAYLFTPPFFVQFGHHYFAGTELANTGWYYCDPPDNLYDCEARSESLASAIARDPHIGNWFPVRLEFIRFD